jgi:ankyrin repeat protein
MQRNSNKNLEKNTLIKAIDENNLNGFKWILRRLSKVPLSSQTKSVIRGLFRSIFMKICQQKEFNEEMVKILIESADHSGDTLLHIACSQEEINIPLITFLLKKAPHLINAQNSNFKTPFHYAAYCNHKDLIELMLEYGAKPNSKMNNGVTPFHYVCMSGDKELVKLLLQKRANPNVQDNKGRTPLHYVCELDPQQYVFKKGIFVTCEKEILEIILLLLRYGADLELKDDNGHTPLYWACFHQHLSIARLLFKCGALLVDNSSLEWVCYKGNSQMAQLLLQEKANFDIRNNDGETLLHIASGNNPELVEVLLDKGVDPTIVDLQGNSPLHKACTVMNDPVKKITLNQCIKIINLLINFVEKKHGVKAVFEMITAKNSDGFTPMMIAGRYWNRTNGSYYIRAQDDGCLTEVFDTMTLDNHNKIMTDIFDVCDEILKDFEELELKEIN